VRQSLSSIETILVRLVLTRSCSVVASSSTPFDQIYEDTIYGEDAIFMERNSRDFRPRIATINQNSELLCDFLRARSLADDRPPANAVLKDVFYPKWSTAANYIQCRRKVPPAGDTTGRFGGLFSLTFTSTAASEAFYDTLRCAKGPSLGTTLRSRVPTRCSHTTPSSPGRRRTASTARSSASASAWSRTNRSSSGSRRRSSRLRQPSERWPLEAEM
jgi:cystathionine beta-lyase/cystathionine gamma-synthase